ncbi:hypothetical protein ACVW04_005784 [Bradyrhizobium sp. LM2.3]
MEVYLAQSRGFCAGVVGAMGRLKNKAETTVSKDITWALQARFTDIQGTGHPGYLLCDTEPPICGKELEQAGRCDLGGGRCQ